MPTGSKGKGKGKSKGGGAAHGSSAVEVVKGIVYGNTATHLKTPDATNTHTWTLFVKSATKEPIEGFIKKVSFTLHSSFANHIRVVDQPPFEITEVGWGEFEVQLKLYFHLHSLKCLTIKHLLKLFPAENTVMTPKNVLVSEVYDEIIFSNPTESLLTQLAPKTAWPFARTDAHDYQEEEDKQMQLVQQAQKKVRHSMRAAEERHQELQTACEALEEEIASLEQGDGMMA
eukprot:m.138062 g.138062  ORF g.138062 m.138062 type:complete len:230 (+) comp14007_c0_seq2:151-840(+)